MKFKVGDRVRNKYNDICSIISIEGERGYKIRREIDSPEAYNSTFFWKAHELTKIGGSMSKYDELKGRIEALDNGWDKEADDILLELHKVKSNNSGLVYFNQSWHTIHLEIRPESKGNINIVNINNVKLVSFYYNTQCQKMKAFKDALLWLLDHSNIKDTKEPIRKEIKELRERLTELENKL